MVSRRRRTSATAARRLTLALAVLAGCARRPASVEPVHEDMSVAPGESGGVRVCEEQAVVVEDALARLADRYLWEEVDKLLQLYVVARRGAGFEAAGERCAATTRDALATVALRWAEQGAETAGAQSHDLARRAFRELSANFPAAAGAPRLQAAMGHLEFVRADRISLDLGERTLTDEAYRRAHEHHRTALAGGLPPELQARSAYEQLEAIRRVHDGEQVQWNMSEHTCVPDRRGRCNDPKPRAAPQALTGADAEWLAAYDAFLAVPALRDSPEAVAVATERAALLMRYRRWDEAEASLRAIVGPGRSEARQLLLGLLLARWMDAVPAGERAAARAALIEAAAAIDAADGAVGASAQYLRRAALWAQAEEAELAGDHARCGETFAGLYPEIADDRQAAAEAADGAGRCYERAGMTREAIEWLTRLADEHRDDEERANNAVLRLARLHERILDDEPARARYLDFLARAPKARQAYNARSASLRLALRAGTLPEEQIAALVRGRGEERALAAAIRFRAVGRAGATAAEIEGYIERFGKDGGPRRLAIAHARAAEALLRSSCPVAGVEGPCVQVGRDQTPTRVVPREPRMLAQAHHHLERAQKVLADLAGGTGEGGDDAREPLYAVGEEEVRTAQRRVALLQGDLDAESALSTRPPASLDPTRSRSWLDRRREEVERMSAVYEKASPSGSEGGDGAAALVERRKAQVYESDLALLEEVATAVEAAGDAGLAAQMRELAAQRREAVFAAYTRCLESIAAWGHDPAGQAAQCRAGLGRLVGRFEEPLEYVPDGDGRVRVSK